MENGGMRIRLSEKLTKRGAAAMLSAVLLIGAAAPALGGSVTRPGDTIGFAVGVPLPPGVYFANTATYDCRDTSPGSWGSSVRPASACSSALSWAEYCLASLRIRGISVNRERHVAVGGGYCFTRS